MSIMINQNAGKITAFSIDGTTANVEDFDPMHESSTCDKYHISPDRFRELVDFLANMTQKAEFHTAASLKMEMNKCS